MQEAEGLPLAFLAAQARQGEKGGHKTLFKAGGKARLAACLERLGRSSFGRQCHARRPE
jgi:hypothetical protein